MGWATSDILSVTAIIFSVFFSVLTLILNGREDPNIMPIGSNSDDGYSLALSYINSSDINLHKVSILINGYDSNFNEIPKLHIQDKYLFTIWAKSDFNFRFNINEFSTSNFFFRVRFKGEYFSRIPLWPIQKFEQVIWYSAIIQGIDGDKVGLRIFNTHREELVRLEDKFKVSLSEYEKSVDKKFS